VGREFFYPHAIKGACSAAAPSRSGSSSALPVVGWLRGSINGAYDARRLIEEDNAIIEFGGQDALDQTCAEALAVGGFTLGPSCVRGAGAWPGAAHSRPAAAPDRDVHFRLNRTVLPLSGWALDRVHGCWIRPIGS